MNVNFGDSGLIVDFIQSFLQNHYSNSVRMSRIYDSDTHNTLIKYLNIYNVRDVNYLYNRIVDEVADINRYLISYKNADDITFYTKTDDQESLDYITSIRDSLTQISKECGWKIKEFRVYSVDGRFKILINKTMYENIIPNRELIPLVNLFYDKYKYNYDIINQSITENYDTDYKLAVMECEPNTEYTICHAYNCPINVTVACTRYDMKNFRNAFCSKVVETYMGREVYYRFTTDSDSKLLIVKIPYNKTGAQSYSIVIPIVIGDVNLDGKVDLDDVSMLQSYFMGQVELDEAQLFAANVLHHPSYADINDEDLALIEQYALSGTNGGIENFTQVISSGMNDKNVLLVTKDPGNINYPLWTFNNTNKWAVHSKFIDFLLGMAVTEYSSETDIKYIQQLLIKLYNTTSISANGIFDQNTKNYVYNYQRYNSIPFALGYVDAETEAKLVKDVDNDKVIGYIDF